MKELCRDFSLRALRMCSERNGGSPAARPTGWDADSRVPCGPGLRPRGGGGEALPSSLASQQPEGPPPPPHPTPRQPQECCCASNSPVFRASAALLRMAVTHKTLGGAAAAGQGGVVRTEAAELLRSLLLRRDTTPAFPCVQKSHLRPPVQRGCSPQPQLALYSQSPVS